MWCSRGHCSFATSADSLMSRDASLREEARALLEEKASDREQVLKRYEAALQMNGDPAKGRQVFDRVCAKCHKLNGTGHDVGPGSGNHSEPPAAAYPARHHHAEQVDCARLRIVRDRNQLLRHSRRRAGTAIADHPHDPSRRGQGRRVRRTDIKDMHVTNLSAMPADLEKQVSVREMADLLNYLKQSP